jgi:hypothetical protein
MNDGAMISLLAPVGVSPEEIDEWVEERVYRLRARWRFTGVGIGRLTRSCPSEGGHWLIELDLRARTVPPSRDVALAAIVTDLERLGLRPRLFVSARAAPPVLAEGGLDLMAEW